MEHIMSTFFQLVFWAMVFATCDSPNGRDLWDAAIDYVDRQNQPEPQKPQWPCDWYYTTPEWCKKCQNNYRSANR